MCVWGGGLAQFAGFGARGLALTRGRWFGATEVHRGWDGGVATQAHGGGGRV